MGKKKNFALEETTSQGPAGVPLSASNESNDGDQPARGEAATETTASSTSNQNNHNHHNHQQQQQQHNHQNNSLNNNNTPTSPGPPSAIVIEDDSNFHIPPMMSTSGPPPLKILEQNKHNIDDNINDHEQQQQQQHEEEEHMSLLELGEETMAQAMLIFLLADLRILSATGRIRTLFEHLALDSDRSPRLTSRDYAGFYDYEDTEGVTASHIMAILLVEILREAEDVAKDRNKKPRHPHHHRRRYKPALLSPWASATDASNHHHHHHAGVNARKIFKRDIRAANGMPSLLHCYNEMLSEDVNPKIARVSRRMYPLDEDIILMMKGHAGGGGVGVGGGYNNNNSTNWIETMESGEEVATGGGGTPEFFPEDEVSLGGASWNNTSNSTPQKQQQQQQQQQYPSSFTTPGGPTFIPPIPKPQSLMNIERSASLSFSQYTQHSHKSGGGASVGGGGGGLATPATPATPPTVSASRTMQRRASTNLEPSHFNPNVDMEDEKDDDSVQLVDQLFAPGGSKKSQLQSQSSQLHEQKEDQAAAAAASLNHHQQTPSSPVNKKNINREDSTESTIGGGGGGGGGTGTPTHHNSTQPTPSAVAVSSSALAMMHASMPSLNNTFKEIRERVEKAIPEQLSIRVEQLTKNFPKGPVARQQQELDEIAQMQNQLLKWGEDSEELVATTTNTTSGGAKASSGRETTSAASTARRKELRKELAQLREKFRSHHEQEHDDGGDDAGGGGGGGGAAGDGNSSIAEEEEGVEVSTPLSDDGDDGDVSLQIPEYHDSDTIRQLILQALDKRDFWRLGFIKTFFREGTVSHILANSRAEMVWLSDWHTQHECTYAISIDREKQKVLLAFRGAYTETDWRHIVDWYDTATSNPVKEDYPNRPNNIRLHSGFHKYLFRVRKDTGTTKYDEITAKLRHYCKLTGPNTRITITGHSLGAALAAIFSLYASTEDRFTDHCGAIECVTFGAPCIGNWRFAGAVKHQENVGKLRIAKFHVKGDSVPHLPPALIRYSSRGAQYWHSGIDVSLPYIRPNNFFQKFLGGQPKPKITYWDPDKESYLGSLCRQFREYYVWNLPIRFWRFALFHTLVEHKKRMALVSKSDPNSLLTKYSLKELYEMREDLTRRPFWKRSEEGRKKS